MARFYLTVQQGVSIQARDGAGFEDLRRLAEGAMAAWTSWSGAPEPALGDGHDKSGGR